MPRPCSDRSSRASFVGILFPTAAGNSYGDHHRRGACCFDSFDRKDHTDRIPADGDAMPWLPSRSSRPLQAGVACRPTWRQSEPNWKIRDWSGCRRGFPVLDARGYQPIFRCHRDLLVARSGRAGGYYAASRLANLFAIVLDALFTYAARYVPPLYYSGRHDELTRQLVLMAEVVIICVIIGLAVFVGGAKPLLGIFGAAFLDQQTTLILLAIGTAIQALGGPAAVILLTTGHERPTPGPWRPTSR